MFCNQCGAAIQEGQRFCSGCGRPLGPVQTQRADNVKILGILWIAMSAFRLLPGVTLLTISQAALSFLPVDVPFFVPGLLHLIGVVFLIGAGIGFLAGWGLIDRQPWARMLAMVLGVLSLPDFPFGTALGIYTLWTLSKVTDLAR
jgi:predicted nucleic acid-binding Zn ribbon protein